MVLIGLDGKRFESPLPDVPAASVVPMVTADVRRHEPLHPATEISIFMRPQQQVEMVCHQTISSQPHRNFFVSLPHQTHKRGEVIIFMKNVTATIAPVQDMVNKPTS
jgi:hypothetical protein